MHNLIIKQRAHVMMQEAFDWYEQQKPGLGELFITELNTYFNKLKSNPGFYGKIYKNFRQVVLKKFPYALVYEIIKTDVLLFAVFHTSRNPNFKFKD